MTDLALNAENFMKNAQGAFIPTSKVKPLDKLRDETVHNMIKQAQELSNYIATIKTNLFAEFNDFLALSAAEYNTKLGGEKGNVTLTSFDGSFKISLASQNNIAFDERLQVAKKLIDDCVHDWSDGANDNIKVLVNHAFDVDKEGKISTHRVLGLRRLDINDENWLKAMQAINDSITVTDSKEYIRFYIRDDKGKYNQIPVDFASA